MIVGGESGLDMSGPRPGAATLTVTFKTAGTYEYLCTVAWPRRRRRVREFANELFQRVSCGFKFHA
jgi:hypothetical protein